MILFPLTIYIVSRCCLEEYVLVLTTYCRKSRDYIVSQAYLCTWEKRDGDRRVKSCTDRDSVEWKDSNPDRQDSLAESHPENDIRRILLHQKAFHSFLQYLDINIYLLD